MASGSDDGSERFSHAWEQRSRQRAHADATGPTRPTDDPDLARDLDLAAALRDAGGTVPGPDAEASARMRAGLMEAIGAGAPARDAAGTERVLDGARRPGSAGGRGAGRADRHLVRGDRTASTRPRDERPTGRPAATPRRARTRTRTGRMLTTGMAGLCATLLLAALTVVISRGALPGETLYGVKRASESIEMGLTSGAEARGRKHLDFAETRLEEISGLMGRSSATAAGSGPVAAGIDPSQAALVGDNLTAFQDQARQGARLMMPLISRPQGGTDGRELSRWAQEQSTRLDTLGPSLPPQQRQDAEQSRLLMQRLGERATALQTRGSCDDGTSGEDELGPVPSAATCGTDAAPPAPTPSITDTTSETSTSRSSTTSESSSTTSSTTSTTSTTSSSTSETAPGPTLTRAPVKVPAPVPGLPPVEVPPLLPGLPGISLGG